MRRKSTNNLMESVTFEKNKGRVRSSEYDICERGGNAQRSLQCFPTDYPPLQGLGIGAFSCGRGSRVVLDESRSFFRVHTGYFSNIPKCIKAEFIASWACSQSSVVRAPSV
ncbi:hypothetical protein TNCV_1156981 [Trichonephila clavipes]|nr:hypothetical protein TNCV_1156981 [Trichonephila clavipes]